MFLFCFVLLEISVGKTPNAFIFSLNNFEGLAPFVSRVKKTKIGDAVFGGSGTGPIFGQDLSIYLTPPSGRQSNVDLGQYYSVPALVKDKRTILLGHHGSFSPDEVEVFYLDPSR